MGLQRRNKAKVSKEEKEEKVPLVKNVDMPKPWSPFGGRWVQIKLGLCATALALGSVLCHMKAQELQQEIDVAWGHFDEHCTNGEGTEECAMHLVHLRHDETMQAGLASAVYGGAFLSVICIYLLATWSKEKLNSNVL